jgi:hypothetical protein
VAAGATERRSAHRCTGVCRIQAANNVVKDFYADPRRGGNKDTISWRMYLDSRNADEL